MPATDYQVNQIDQVLVNVPIKLARKLKISPGAVLTPETYGDLREAMGAPRAWPRRVPDAFPKKEGRSDERP